LVLDAFGVLYNPADDVEDLLIPFIGERAGVTDKERIRRAYIDASLGRQSAPEFWKSVGVDPAAEDDYLCLHALIPGARDVLEAARPLAASICCLSNDVSEWSCTLRKRFELERQIGRWFISGDIGLRKPDPEIFRYMLRALHVPAEQIVFVDDRPANIAAAESIGMRAILFKTADALIPILTEALAS
jgi:putative hydrolase of the HAD superfamily